MTAAWPVDLRPYFNARAATRDDERVRGGFNAWGNSFPAEELTFAETIEVGGLPFRLEQLDELDHLEADDQHVLLPDVEASALAFLAFGEMGRQSVRIAVDAHSQEVAADGWLIDGDRQVERALDCSHLHYPGGYELAHLRPVMWPYVVTLPSRRTWRHLRIDANPLFHIAAATLLA